MKNFRSSCLCVSAFIIGIMLIQEISCPPGSESKNRGVAIAIAIGLNKVNPEYYDGWDGKCSGCLFDTEDMKNIAEKAGLEAKILTNKDATRDAVLEKLEYFSDTLKSGDLLVVSYSGHGGQIPDYNGDEKDQLDETWCLYDGQLLDDEIHGALANFKPGVRILLFSDSCHSGTIFKMLKSDYDKNERDQNAMRIEQLKQDYKLLRTLPNLERQKVYAMIENNKKIEKRVKTLPSQKLLDIDKPADLVEMKEMINARLIPPDISIRTHEKFKDFYTKIGKQAPREDTTLVKASVIQIAGCEEGQLSADLGWNGLFTMKLKEVWKEGVFNGDHDQFYQDIKKLVLQEYSEQSPALETTGPPEDIISFKKQRPYTVE